MSRNDRLPTGIVMLVAFSALFPCSSCELFVWNANLKSFVDDGLSIVNVKSSAAIHDGSATAVVPSGEESTLILDMLNPRSVEITCSVRGENDSLFDRLPGVTAASPTTISLSFTPSLQAERKDLVFTVEVAAPSLNRTYDPEVVTVHCNTPPGSVGPSLDAALDVGGIAFAAFRLPSSPSDDDLARVEITHTRADGTGGGGTVTLPVDDPSLSVERRTPTGTDILGPDGPLDRYYEPGGLSSGDDYLFTVTLIDTEGLRSAAAQTTSNATTYSMTYSGNGNTGGSAPVDPATYRQTKPVTVPGPGTLLCVGHYFTVWNTAADGSGTPYAAGSTYTMGSFNAVLYAQWGDAGQVEVTFSTPGYQAVVFSYGGSEVHALGVARSPTPIVLSYKDAGSTVSGWAWYLDGVNTGVVTGSYPVDVSVNGRFVVSCTALSAGVKYAGSLTVTVSDATTVSYSGNGAVSGFAPAGGTYASGQQVPVVGNTGGLVRPGYRWLGWSTNPAAAAAQYGDGDTFFMGLASITLFAVWGPDTVLPAPVTGLTGTTGPGRVILSWIDPAHDDLAGIRVEYAGGSSGTVTVAKGALTVQVGGLVDLAGYTFTVWAFDETGNFSAGVSYWACPNGPVEADYAFNAATGTITGYTGASTALVIPDSIGGVPVTDIGDSAFANRADLTSIVIGRNVTNVGNAAFFSCFGVTSLVIGSSVKTIEYGAFENMDSLMTVTIPDSVVTIGDIAFQTCDSLQTVYIGSGVTSIGFQAFSGDIALLTVHLTAVIPPSLGLNAFLMAPPALVIEVPWSSLAAYQAAWPAYALNIYGY